MAIPDYQTCMLPLLKFYGDGKEHAFRDAVDTLASEFKLTYEELNQMLPSGQRTIFNRVGWARSYLKQADLLEGVKRGVHRITKRGLNVLKQKPTRIDVSFLEQFEEFRAFRLRKRSKATDHEEMHDAKTPEESLESAHQRLREDLAVELLQSIGNPTQNTIAARLSPSPAPPPVSQRASHAKVIPGRAQHERCVRQGPSLNSPTSGVHKLRGMLEYRRLRRHK